MQLWKFTVHSMKKDGFAEEIEEIMQKYTELDVTVTIDEQKLLYKKDNEALIDVISTTRTPEFDPYSNWQNDRQVIYLLTKEEDQWKISSERVVKVTYLNEDGTLDTKYENFPGIDYSEYWDAKIKELQELDILPSEYLVQLEEEAIASEAKELEEVVKKFDQYLNERDLEGWNSLLLFDEDKDDQEMMDVREEAKMKRETVNFELLHTNGQQAIVYVDLEFRQDREFNPYDNWNSNVSLIQIFERSNGDWKLHSGYTLYEAWLLEDGTEDPADTYNYNKEEQLQLVEKIINENLDPIATLNEYHDNNF